MDKETLGNYGWVVIVLIILALMISLATPFASVLSKNIKDSTLKFMNVVSDAMNNVTKHEGFDDLNSGGGFGDEIGTPPVLLEGDGQSVNKAIGSSFAFRSSANYDTFKEVRVDDEVVDPKYYTVSEGSTIIIFNGEYAIKLSVGNHTISIVSRTGSANGMFDVVEEDVVVYDGDVKLPAIPADLLKEYPYAFIRKNTTTGYYDLALSDSAWGKYGGVVREGNLVKGRPWYRVKIATAESATEWVDNTAANSNYNSFTIDETRQVLWSNYDIPNGRSMSDIYFEGDCRLLPNTFVTISGTWELNEEIDIPTKSVQNKSMTYLVDFTSVKTDCATRQFGGFNFQCTNENSDNNLLMRDLWNGTTVHFYNFVSNTYAADFSRTIIFDGDQVVSKDFYDWFKENAKPVAGTNLQYSNVNLTTGEILDSWSEIRNSINDGTYKTKYAVGNYKRLYLGSEGLINMQIVAFDTDILSDGSGKAPITWIAKDLLATPYGMNGSNGWGGSQLRSYLANNIWELVPVEVRDAIVAVDKTYYNYSTQSTLTCSDKLWIPSAREIGLRGVTCESSSIVYDEVYGSTKNLVKRRIGANEEWWTRSANYAVAGYFTMINTAGGSDTRGTSTGLGIALSFCMGKSASVDAKEDLIKESVNLNTGEILDSWDEIIAHVNDGSYLYRYSIGDYKELNLGTEGVIHMQVAAFNADTLSDGSGKARITWIAREILSTSHTMNSNNTNGGGWVSSGMRKYLANDVWNMVPENIQNAIVEVNKTYCIYNSSTARTCADKLWIPSAREVRVDEYYVESSGPVYGDLFSNDESRIKLQNGNALAWWLRSANRNYSTNFYYSGSKGNGNHYYATDKYGVVIGFCM